ncbi:MAG: DUF3108 domain-containing protein [Salinivirgaceae bacterium]|nr:DUF3108 domain-containing protein [Salinivirgaceae bacterium]
MMCKKQAIVFFLCLLPLFAHPQINYNYGKFKSGESFTLDIYYNWGFIWLNAGWAKFEIRDTLYNKTKALHLYSTGATNPGYDWFFKVRDTYEAIVEPNEYRPYWFRCNTHEGSFWDKEEAVFNYADSIAITKTETAKRAYGIDTIKINRQVTDLVSAIYICRSIDFKNIKVNQQVPIPVIVGNKFYNLHIRYLGKEDVTDRNEKTHTCRKFAVMMVSGTIFNGGEDLVAWVTADDKCVPILVQAKIAVGSIKAFLSKYEENAYKNEKK